MHPCTNRCRKFRYSTIGGTKCCCKGVTGHIINCERLVGAPNGCTLTPRPLRFREKRFRWIVVGAEQRNTSLNDDVETAVARCYANQHNCKLCYSHPLNACRCTRFVAFAWCSFRTLAAAMTRPEVPLPRSLSCKSYCICAMRKIDGRANGEKLDEHSAQRRR